MQKYMGVEMSDLKPDLTSSKSFHYSKSTKSDRIWLNRLNAQQTDLFNMKTDYKHRKTVKHQKISKSLLGNIFDLFSVYRVYTSSET